jgi:hypothetical protein
MSRASTTCTAMKANASFGLDRPDQKPRPAEHRQVGGTDLPVHDTRAAPAEPARQGALECRHRRRGRRCPYPDGRRNRAS